MLGKAASKSKTMMVPESDLSETFHAFRINIEYILKHAPASQEASLKVRDHTRDVGFQKKAESPSYQPIVSVDK